MSNPTRILYLIGSLDVGGTERHLAMLVRSLNRARWQPAIYTLNRKGTLAPELEAAGVAIHSPLQLSWFARAGLLGRAARLVVVGVSLFAHLVRSRPPIVHCFLPASYLIGLPIALITRRPIRLMSRRSLNDYQRKGPLLARFERMLHGSVAAVLGNSRAVIRELEEEGIDKDRLRLIYNGIDVERTRPRIDRADTRARLGIALDVPVLINVANLIPYKGHLDLLEALGRARTKLPPHWRLICVGRDDGIGPALRAKASARGLSDHVLWLGERHDVADLLAASDIGLLCSHEEGFSNAVLEGMSAGLPMVVTDVGGNAEAVIDGQCGLVVPPRDPAALAEAILRLASDGDLRQRLGAAAGARVGTEFNLVRCVREYERLYESLLLRVQHR